MNHSASKSWFDWTKFYELAGADLTGTLEGNLKVYRSSNQVQVRLTYFEPSGLLRNCKWEVKSYREAARFAKQTMSGFAEIRLWSRNSTSRTWKATEVPVKTETGATFTDLGTLATHTVDGFFQVEDWLDPAGRQISHLSRIGDIFCDNCRTPITGAEGFSCVSADGREHTRRCLSCHEEWVNSLVHLPGGFPSISAKCEQEAHGMAATGVGLRKAH